MKKITYTRSVPDPGDAVKSLIRSAWVYCAAALALTPSVIWIARDRAVWPWDQAFYGEVSVDLWYSLTHSIYQWCVGMVTAVGIKPPGAVWLGQLFVPLHGVLGSVETALFLSILLTQFAVLALILKIGQCVCPSSRLVPAAGVLFAAGAQSFVGLSHEFFVEPLQAFAVAWILYIAAKSRQWPSARVLLHLLAALAVGVLAKVTTPVYCLLFCLYIAWVIFRRPLQLDIAGECKRPSSRALIVFLAGLIPLTALWYKVNLKAVWRHAQDSASGEVALHYGFRAPVWQKIPVWLNLAHQSFLSPYLCWTFLAALVLVIAFRLQRHKGTSEQTPSWALCLLSVGQIVLLLLAFARADTVEARYLYPMVVYLAFLFMNICALIPSRTVVVALLAACCCQCVVANRVAFGFGGSFANQFPYLLALHPDRSGYDELTRAVLRTESPPSRYNIVGVEETWLNANSAAFFAAKVRLQTGIRSYYTSLGYAETDVAKALKRMEELSTHYYITLDEPFQTKPPNFVNVVSLPVLRQVRQDPRFHPVPFPTRKGILIFERH